MNNNYFVPYENPNAQVRWGAGILEQEKELTCPLCSQRVSDLDETYFVGCPMCYKIFESEVLKLAESYHGTSQHFGKTPKRGLNKMSITKELIELSNQESEAVKNRDYAKAEEVKRKIDALKGENYGSF